MMRRILTQLYGYPVHYVMNITDIDDKIIAQANKEGADPSALAKKWEKEFFTQMDRLGVMRPDEILRVSEHVADIITYIQTIIQNGFAYESGGSVYFDVGAFKKAGHQYCKLMPSAQNDLASQEQEQEFASQKRSPLDFALWKKSKPGEPFWGSPWGTGRPGWHIECSAMINSFLSQGENLMIHSGGADLKFPHHDNEIAQGEAHDCSHDWVKYFIHVSPLNIKGLKMSKSLKNFITVEEALKLVTGRQLRLLFLSHKYNNPMNLDPEGSFEQARQKDRTINEFIAEVEHDLHSTTAEEVFKLTEEGRQLQNKLHSFMSDSHRLLKTNFDTGSVIQAFVNELIPAYRSAKQSLKKSEKKLPSPLLQSILKSVHTLLLSLGLQYSKASSPLANPFCDSLTSPSTTSFQSSLPPSEAIIDQLVTFRKDIITLCRSSSAAASNAPSNDQSSSKPSQQSTASSPPLKNYLLNLCDRLRDQSLKSLGIRVEDGRDKNSGKDWYWDPSAAVEVKKNGERNDGQRGQESGMQASIFFDKKYSKFEIGEIGADGLPVADKKGQEFPPKVMERFRRDLERHKASKCDEINK
jgi:cysteinyl-tRNA synthetase